MPSVNECHAESRQFSDLQGFLSFTVEAYDKFSLHVVIYLVSECATHVQDYSDWYLPHHQ